MGGRAGLRALVGPGLTNGVAAAGRAAQCCPLLVEAVLAALAVASGGVALAVDAVEPPAVLEAVLGPPIAGALAPGCGGENICISSLSASSHIPAV